MTWYDFLRYSKYIAVFYGAAFVLMLFGIWAGDTVNYKLIWSAVLFFGTAIAGNVALASYHYNHKGSMNMAKNEYLVEQDAAQVITDAGDSKSLALRATEADLEEHIRQIARKAVRDERGY